MSRPHSFSADAQRTLDAIDRTHGRETRSPGTAVTRLDVPFEDVFFFALKFFAAQVIIGAPFAALIWFAFLR